MDFISQRLQALSPSATLAMSQKSAELKAQGVDVINLSVGEPDFTTPDHIKQAAKQAVDDNFSFYSPVPGYLSLRQAISDKLKNENNLDFAPEQIVVGNGAKQALCNTVLCLVNPGDEVIIPTPAWVSYVQMVNLAGGKSVLVPATLDQNFKITPAQLEAAITDKTRLIILCSPSNPTGSIYSRDELRSLADVLARQFAQFENIRDRVAIINGVSKAYAMTGYRIGYVAAPLWLAKAVNKLQGQYTSGASSIAQKAAEAAYTGSQQCVEDMRVAFERRRNLIVSLFRDIPGVNINVPDGAFYLFPEVSSFFGKKAGDTVINDANDLALYLLNEAHVATVAGDAFCCPGYIRLSYATSDENIIEAAARIKAALARLA